MKLIKFTIILLCFLMAVSVFAGCNTTEESKADVNSKDSLLQNSEDTSEEISDETSEEVSQALDFVIIDYRNAFNYVRDEGIDVFFQDENYIYFYSESPDTAYIIVEYTDGTTQNIKEAFESGNITIADLDRFDISYMKMPVD